MTDQSDRGGPALGLLPGVNYTTTIISLSPRDRILLFTDGIVEAEGRDSRQFGLDGLINSLRRNLGRGDGLLELIENDVRSFAGSSDFQDDVCLVMVQWHPSR